MPCRRFSIHRIVRAQPPLTPEQIADWWAKKNDGVIAEIAMRSMLDPVGTVYVVPPLRFVAFQTPDARILHQLRLHKATKGKHVVEHAVGQHIEDLVLFCREQVRAALSKLDAHATFQRDEFAVRR